MLTVEKVTEDRLDIELSGQLDAGQMNIGLDELLLASSDITAGKMLYTISDFEMPTLGALTIELQYLPQLLRLLRNFKKCAVVSDIAWIRTAAEIEGAVLPGIEIRAFTENARDHAEAWLDKLSDTADTAENFPV